MRSKINEKLITLLIEKFDERCFLISIINLLSLPQVSNWNIIHGFEQIYGLKFKRTYVRALDLLLKQYSNISNVTSLKTSIQLDWIENKKTIHVNAIT